MSYVASRKHFTSVLYVIMVLVSLPIIIFLLWLIVRCVTTSYSLEWVGGDGRAWEESRELPVENGGRLFVKLDYLNYKRKDRYAITIECGRDFSLKDEFVTLQFVGRDMEPCQLHVYEKKLPAGRCRYFAALPIAFMPQKENDVLLIKFRVCADGGSRNNEIALEFKSRLVRHYVDLITDIT